MLKIFKLVLQRFPGYGECLSLMVVANSERNARRIAAANEQAGQSYRDYDYAETSPWLAGRHCETACRFIGTAAPGTLPGVIMGAYASD